MCTKIYISHFKEHKQAKKPENTKKAKETKEEKRISPENRSKKKLVAVRVKIFLVTRISRNKSIFWPGLNHFKFTFFNTKLGNNN